MIVLISGSRTPDNKGQYFWYKVLDKSRIKEFINGWVQPSVAAESL